MSNVGEKRSRYIETMIGLGYSESEAEGLWKKDKIVVKGMRYEEIANFTRDNYKNESRTIAKNNVSATQRPEEHILLDELIRRNKLSENSINEDLAAFNSVFDRWAFGLGAGYGLLSSFFDGHSSGGEMLFGAVAGLIAIGGSLFAIGQAFDLDGRRNYWAAGIAFILVCVSGPDMTSW